MDYRSILYTSDPPRLSEEPPEAFNDLGLDTLIRFFKRRLEDRVASLVEKLWYTPPDRIEDALYRQEVFADLEDPETLKAIRKFVDEFSNIVSLLHHAEEYASGYQREGMFLGAAMEYVDIVEELLEALKKSRIRSRGLLSFKKYLEDYVSSERFLALKRGAERVAKLLSSIRFCMEIKGSTITVYEKCRSGEDYTVYLEKLFERFRVPGEDGAKEPEWRIEYYRGHVEEAILELVAKFYKEPFEELSRFYRDNRGFVDKGIARFYEEIQFYLSYIDLMELIRSKGLHFTLPRLQLEDGEEYCIDCFDIALALKYAEEGKKVVANSFQFRPGERIIVVTGPNSGGKTTFARMVGQVYYLAKLGVPVPGRRAELCFVDAVYTHFPRGEDVENMRSKLEEDLVRLRGILEKATARSVIVINELFSSTATYDAARLGKKILEKIRSIGSRCIYVTFVNELARLDYVASYVAQVDPKNPEIRTYRVIRQPATGLTYARLIARKYGLTYEDIVSRVGE